MDERAYESDSDTNSLSPPPPSTGPKTQALPKVDPAQQGSLLEEEESDLESLTTDSNEDEPQKIEADEAKHENRSESDRPDQGDEDEEEADGDVTMRAGDLDLEVEGGDEKEEEGAEVTEGMRVDESGENLEHEQEAEVEGEAQPEDPEEEEVEEAPRKLDNRRSETKLTI